MEMDHTKIKGRFKFGDFSPEEIRQIKDIQQFPKYVLQIYIKDNDQGFKDFYMKHIEEHNKRALFKYTDAGFDLPSPKTYSITEPIENKIALGVVIAMFAESARPVSYYLCPRSSISKTFFRMSNSIGIIDSGYRGEIIAMVDNISCNYYREHTQIKKFDRYFQICHPSLKPFLVELVDDIKMLGETFRGEGGFGSTGK